MRDSTGKKRGKLVLQDPHTGDSITNPYIPFSAGPRDCLGQRMGMTEVRSAHPVDMPLLQAPRFTR